MARPIRGRPRRMSEFDGSSQGENTKGRQDGKARRRADVDALSFEEAQAELDRIVATLEGGEIDLDRSLALYERGVALARRCQSLLDSAELRVERLRVPGNESSQGDNLSADAWARTDE